MFNTFWWQLLLFVELFFLYSAARKEPFAIRISCGSRYNVITNETRTLWFKDYAYTGGRPANVSLSRLSLISPLLTTLRYFTLSDGPENCYNINRIPKGHYTVRIFFALVSDSDQEPLFDISVEGTQIYSLTSGWTNKYDQSFSEALIFVKGTSVSLCFHSTGHGNPSIHSIEILQVDDYAYNLDSEWRQGTLLRTAKRLTCGYGKLAFDNVYNGNHWGGDRFWDGMITFGNNSDQSISTEQSIKQHSVSPNFYPEKIYQSAIVSTDIEPELSFSTAVIPNRNYSIWLHFAEIDSRVIGIGKRVFNISINGIVVYDDVDVIKMAGDRYTALVLNKTIAMSGRILTIELKPATGSYAMINAIEIFEIIPAESKTSVQEVRALQTLKNSLGLPLRFGWNGDPCVPQHHPWSGVDCQFDGNSATWFIDGLGLDNQGLSGFLPNDISKLIHLQMINLSGNSIHGTIPTSLGAIVGLQILDLSYNLLNGSIPDSLGQLKSLRVLYLNGNLLSGKVPSTLGGRPLHRASFNFSDNADLCGVPGLPSCNPGFPLGAKIGIALGVLLAFFLIILCSVCWYKRRQNILRAQKISSREAPYAKARTHFRDIQMTRQHSIGTYRSTDSGPPLLP